MWLLAGLGNPGKRYEFTRHNIGFMLIDRLCRLWNVRLKDFGTYMMDKVFIDGMDIILMKPLTYMNRSGEAIKTLCTKMGIPPENVIVIHDDLDMEPGKIRIRKRGSSGGHRGVQSIIEAIGEGFTRLKIGIGRSKEIPPEEYVLQRFSDEELEIINEAIERAIKRLYEIIALDQDEGSNEYRCQ